MYAQAQRHPLRSSEQDCLAFVHECVEELVENCRAANAGDELLRLDSLGGTEPAIMSAVDSRCKAYSLRKSARTRLILRLPHSESP